VHEHAGAIARAYSTTGRVAALAFLKWHRCHSFWHEVVVAVAARPKTGL
jgi:hypothetical protein